MLQSIVRDALVASVTWTFPPVRFQTSHVSIVPNRISPASAFLRAPGNMIEHPDDFGCGKIRVNAQAGSCGGQTVPVLRLSIYRRSPRFAGTARRWPCRWAGLYAYPRESSFRADWKCRFRESAKDLRTLCSVRPHRTPSVSYQTSMASCSTHPLWAIFHFAFFLRHGLHVLFVIKQDGARRCRALVDRQDILIVIHIHFSTPGQPVLEPLL